MEGDEDVNMQNEDNYERIEDREIVRKLVKSKGTKAEYGVRMKILEKDLCISIDCQIIFLILV